jgi:DNA-binding NarL/FixJ family response regulator
MRIAGLASINMPQPFRIEVLIAHSDPLISAGLVATIRKQPDFEVVGCTPESTFAQAMQSQFPSRDVVVADYESAFLLTASKYAWRDRVMILTDRDGEAKICHALEQGARGYLLLGCSLKGLTEGLRSVHVGGIALAVGTVKGHVKSILNKLDAASRTEAVAIAQRRGILAEEPEWPRREPWTRRLIKRPDLDRRAVMARDSTGYRDSPGGGCHIGVGAPEHGHGHGHE